jgi:hypothetical protein
MIYLEQGTWVSKVWIVIVKCPFDIKMLDKIVVLFKQRARIFLRTNALILKPDMEALFGKKVYQLIDPWNHFESFFQIDVGYVGWFSLTTWPNVNINAKKQRMVGNNSWKLIYRRCWCRRIWIGFMDENRIGNSKYGFETKEGKLGLKNRFR